MTADSCKDHIVVAMMEKGRQLFTYGEIYDNDTMVSYYNQVMRVRKLLGFARIPYEEFKLAISA